MTLLILLCSWFAASILLGTFWGLAGRTFAPRETPEELARI